jgi:hypothetical protein
MQAGNSGGNLKQVWVLPILSTDTGSHFFVDSAVAFNYIPRFCFGWSNLKLN